MPNIMVDRKIIPKEVCNWVDLYNLLIITFGISPLFKSMAIRILDKSEGQNHIGAKVSVIFSDDSVQLHEVSAGGGYLSQSAPVVFIGKGANQHKVKSIHIRWPDGSIEKLKVDEFQSKTPSLSFSFDVE